MARPRPPEWWLENRLRLWRYARHLELSAELRHTGEVAPDEDGRPGLRCRFPARPLYGRLNPDRTRTYFQAMLSTRGSIIAAVCFQPAARPGEAWDHAKSCIALAPRSGGTLITPMAATVLCGTPAVTFTVHRPMFTVHEHFLVAHGWLHGIGIVLRGRDGDPVVDLGMRALETWEWIPPVVSSALGSAP